MTLLGSWILVVAAQGGADAVAACRAAHAADPTAHIACLEDALSGRDVPIATTPTAAAPVPAADPAAAPSPAQKTVAAFGSEQLPESRNAASQDVMMVNITSVTYDNQSRGIFQMSDGQIWRETESASRFRQLDPDTPYSGRIERGKLRGYRMYLDQVRRMIKVERLR